MFNFEFFTRKCVDFDAKLVIKPRQLKWKWKKLTKKLNWTWLSRFFQWKYLLWWKIEHTSKSMNFKIYFDKKFIQIWVFLIWAKKIILILEKKERNLRWSEKHSLLKMFEWIFKTWIELTKKLILINIKENLRESKRKENVKFDPRSLLPPLIHYSKTIFIQINSIK